MTIKGFLKKTITQELTGIDLSGACFAIGFWQQEEQQG